MFSGDANPSYCRTLPLDEFSGNFPEPCRVYSLSFISTAVRAFPQFR